MTKFSILVAASFMMAGLGTIIQTLGIGKKIGSKLPMIEGVSFAGVAALTAVGVAYRDVDPVLGIQVMMGATIISGVFCIIVAPVFGKLLKFFPPLVSGVVVTLYGIITYSSSHKMDRRRKSISRTFWKLQKYSAGRNNFSNNNWNFKNYLKGF